MNKIFFKILILILLCFYINNIKAQNSRHYTNDEPSTLDAPTTEEAHIENNDEIVTVNSNRKFINRHYSESKINEFKNDKDFQYDEKEEHSLKYVSKEYLDSLEKKANGKSRQITTYNKQNDNENRSFKTNINSKPLNINWLLISLIGLALILLILYFSGFKPSMFGKNNTKNTDENKSNELNENINNIEFESELDKAINSKNYKLAVRILYLENLKKLSDHKIIDWKINKTNGEYLKEINNVSLQNKFNDITRNFEYIWYGNFTIDEPTFKLVQQKMTSFKTEI